MIVIKSSKLRIALRYALPFLIIPLFTVGGAILFRDKGYSFISLAVVIFSLALFLCGFEKKTVGTRRLVIISAMTAIAVAGRFIFMPVPALTPITAVAIITAMHFGSESGFLVGALSALISNTYAGHGVWTPFQMFAWGILGFLAGIFADELKRSRFLLCIYGFFAGILYSLIMDTWSVLWYNGSFSLPIFASLALTALPHTTVYIASNIVFLMLMKKPFGDKFERVKLKYGA